MARRDLYKVSGLIVSRWASKPEADILKEKSEETLENGIKQVLLKLRAQRHSTLK